MSGWAPRRLATMSIRKFLVPRAVEGVPASKKPRLADTRDRDGDRDGAGASTRSGQQCVDGRPGRTQLGDGAWVDFAPGRLADPHGEIFRILEQEIDWKHVRLRVFGREVDQPRLVCYMADRVPGRDMSYSYSGLSLEPQPWHPEVLRVKKAVEEMAGVTFNSVLGNLYRNGNDSCGWHADNEKLYGLNPVIGSASFGVPRDFILRRNADRSQKVPFHLGPGDLLVMGGTCQHTWQHSVPPRRRVEGARINLTFRTIVAREASDA